MSNKSKAIAKIVDPRVRMKEIRSLVANSVKNNTRIDQMDLNTKDTTRVLIALQDQLEASNVAHRKATNHVMTQKGVIQTVVLLATMTNQQHSSNLKNAGESIDLLIAQRDGLVDQCQALSDGWEESGERVFELGEELTAVRIQLDSALETLRTVMTFNE